MNVKEGTVINSLEILDEERSENPIVVTRENNGDRFPLIESDDGRYVVYRELGVGGSGKVFSGIDNHLERPVAIKISDSRISNPVEKTIFMNEAILGAKLDHPNLAKIFDYTVFKDVDYQGKPLYREVIVEELVFGRDLIAIQKLGVVYSPKKVGEIMSDISGAMDYLHENGLVYRDLKANNIIEYVENGETKYKLIDYSLISRKEDMTGGDTMGMYQLDTKEVMRGEAPDLGSDRYSFLVTMYKLISGVDPFYIYRGNDNHSVKRTKRMTRLSLNPELQARVGNPELLKRMDEFFEYSFKHYKDFKNTKEIVEKYKEIFHEDS